MTTRLTVRKRERSSSTCVLRLLARVAYILFACGACVNAKVFDRCELAQVLHNKHRLDLHEVATWTCIAQHSSDFNTEAYAGGLAGGSHGLFQISDVYWCSPPGKGFACNLPCERLRDADLTDDLSCLRIIYDEHQRLSGDGYNAWNAYQQFCRHGVEQYVQDCFGATQHVIKPAASQNFGHTAPFDNAPAPYYTPNSLSVHTNAISNSYSTHKRGKVYERCELAQELYYKHKMPMEQIPTWVCIAQHESRFDTAAVGRLNADGSADHGLFQISDLYWCSHNRYSGGKACGLQCTKLLDNDITDDVRCIKRIHGEHTRLSGDGFTAWTVYNRNCQNQQYSHVSACFKDQPYEQSVKTTQVHTAHTHTFPSYQAPQGAIQTQYQANPFLNNHIGPAHKPSATTLQHQQHKYTSFPNTHTQTQTQTQTQKHKGKVYKRCELAQELYFKHKFPMQDIATWVCIAQHESNYDTAAVGRLNGDGSADHGLFQISDLYWCSHDSFGGKACNIPCTKLLDSDIGDDVQCVRIIYEEHTRLSGDGFTAWTVYNRNCRNRRLEEVANCFDSNEISKTQQFLTTTTTTTQVSSHSNNYNSKNNSITTTSTGLALPTTKGKIYKECELAQELYYKHHLPLADISTWVCIAKHESRYNTAAVGRLNADGSADHGLFQISDLYWCAHDAYGGKACNIPCHKLLDADISDDVQCIQTIHAEHTRLSGDGFTAWVVYNQHCRNQQWERIASCFPTELETHRMQPAVAGNVGTSAHTEVVTSVGKGKIYKKCELAQELYFKHKMPMQEVPTWVCIAEHESSFNTAAVGRLNADGSADHGLFQISDLYWCSHEVAGGKACHISCNKLLDNDITDDVRCVKTIYEEHTRLSGDGFTAWTVYNRNCRHQQLDRVSSCFDAKELQQAQKASGSTQRERPNYSTHVNSINPITTPPKKIKHKGELNHPFVYNPFLNQYSAVKFVPTTVMPKRITTTAKPITNYGVTTNAVAFSKSDFLSNPFLSQFIPTQKHVAVTKPTPQSITNTNTGSLGSNIASYAANPFLSAYQQTNTKKHTTAAPVTEKPQKLNLQSNPFLSQYTGPLTSLTPTSTPQTSSNKASNTRENVKQPQSQQKQSYHTNPFLSQFIDQSSVLTSITNINRKATTNAPYRSQSHAQFQNNPFLQKISAPTREPQHTRPTPSSTEKTKLHVYPTKPYVNSEIFRTTPVKAHGGATTTPKPARTTPMPQTQTTKQYYAALLTTTTTTRKPTTLATVVRKPTANSAVGTTKRPGTASTWNWRQPQQQILPTKSTTTRKTTIATRNPTSTTRKPTGTTRQPTSTSRKTTFSTTRAPQTTRRSGNIVQSAQKTETINTTKKSLTTKVPKTTKNPGLYQEKKTTWNTVTSTTTRRSQTTQTTVNQKIKNATTTKRPATTQNSSFKKPTTTTTTTRRPTTKQSVTKTTSRTANSQTANNKTNTPTTTRRTTTTVRRTTAATTTRPTRKATTPITVKTPITKKTSTTRRPTTTPTSLNNFSTTKVPYTVKKVTTTPTTFTQYTRTSTLKPKITTAKTTTTTNRPSTAATRKPAAHVASNTSFSTNISNKKSDTGSNKSTSTSAVIPTTNPYRDDPFSHPFFAKYKSQFEIFATTTTRKPTSTTRYQLQSRFGDESEYYQQFRNHTAGNVKTVYAYAFGQNGTVSGNYGK
ncbi:uncharacterized protein LOC105664879 isoform X1 [Ceratitis capitata]|uniref:uncharacterized protein LOC105664879 isoform X1 n=1 Tax=Ceratitis capitata TaxID=7213 RepID=UPI0006187FF8|nr:uncharacterized protein LOC105664879 isoform X1 [Ceratitis capitata]